MADSPVAGWYDDPADATMLRYWDGAAWTDRLRPKNAAAAAPPPSGYAAAPEMQSGGYASSGGYGGGMTGAQKNSGLAVASLVLGILFCVPFASIVAIILGAVALSQISKAPDQLKGRGMAIAGICLGGVSVVFGIIYFVAVLGSASSGY